MSWETKEIRYQQVTLSFPITVQDICEAFKVFIEIYPNGTHLKFIATTNGIIIYPSDFAKTG